jgi:hypothetical protein
MNQLYTFGYRLAELTKQSDITCFGMLCLAVKDAGKNAQDMGYKDFQIVFQTYLPKRLERIKLANTDTVIAEMMKTLNEKQSVFTMAAR